MEKVVLKEKIHLRSFNLTALQTFLESIGAPHYRASQIMGWLHKKHVMDFPEMKNLPKELQMLLAEKTVVSTLERVDIVGGGPCLSQHPFSPKGGEGKDEGANPLIRPSPQPSPQGGEGEFADRDSFKFLMRTQDGHLLESVLIAQKDRRTVCLSTQLGCRIRCTFCASGKGKFGRNLTAGEMVEQVSVISRHRGQPITNVVFMGMGEPLDNYEATMRAIEILTADWGFDLGGRRITVSTSGITPMIEKFVKDSRGRVRLSVSLHSSDQETRSRLVPISKKYRLDELIQTLERIQKTLKREITFEYTLIQGVNDSKGEARGVGRIASRLGAKVNVIPYNPIREMDYKTPDREHIEAFRKLLEAKNVRVTVRQTAGRDIDAACGQLRLDRSPS